MAAGAPATGSAVVRPMGRLSSVKPGFGSCVQAKSWFVPMPPIKSSSP